MIEAEVFYGLEWMSFSTTLLSFIRTLIMFITLGLTARWLGLEKTKAMRAEQTHLLSGI